MCKEAKLNGHLANLVSPLSLSLLTLQELADGILSLVEGNSEKLKEATGGLNSAFKGIVGDFADLVGA